jgi:hypothetical protein
MKKFQRVNLTIFLCLIAVTSIFFYISEKTIFSQPLDKPWHLQPTVHEDSLTDKYKTQYKILGKQRLSQQLGDTTRIQVYILVNAWGVPVDETLLAEDFSAFADLPHVFALHQRLANRTKHAELTEFRNEVPENVYLFGGDSLEYGRTDYIPQAGFAQSIFCQHCSDSVMLAKVDSLLQADSLKFIAWTSQSSRTGDRDSLHLALRRIADFTRIHPEILFIVQGTHRPTLGTPEARKSYKAHWVPAAVLNYRE